MSRAPRVSVIIIFLDAERFLAEAIDSVLAQTFTDWELLLVDDGSTDGSANIARGYVRRYPDRISFLQHPGGANRGMSATRNLGIACARGDCIAFLDADDIWLPPKLENQLRLLDAFPSASMVYGPTLLWYDWQEPGSHRNQLRPLGVEPDQLIEPPRLIPLFLRGEALPPATCAALVRRAAALEVGGFEESFRGMSEDQVFFYKLCLVKPVYVSGECWDWYRQHGESASALAEAEGQYDSNGPNQSAHRFLGWFSAYAAAGQQMDGEIAAAFKTAMWPYRHPRAAWVRRKLTGAAAKLRRLAWRLSPYRRSSS